MSADHALFSDLGLRLQRSDVDALMDLYDQTAAAVYGDARRKTRSKSEAYAATREAYLVRGEPGLLTDSIVPYVLQMAVIAERVVNCPPAEPAPRRYRELRRARRSTGHACPNRSASTD